MYIYHLLGRGKEHICDKWEASVLLEFNVPTLLCSVGGSIISCFRYEMCNLSLFIFEIKLFCYILTSLVGFFLKTLIGQYI